MPRDVERSHLRASRLDDERDVRAAAYSTMDWIWVAVSFTFMTTLLVLALVTLGDVSSVRDHVVKLQVDVSRLDVSAAEASAVGDTTQLLSVAEMGHVAKDWVKVRTNHDCGTGETISVDHYSVVMEELFSSQFVEYTDVARVYLSTLPRLDECAPLASASSGNQRVQCTPNAIWGTFPAQGKVCTAEDDANTCNLGWHSIEVRQTLLNKRHLICGRFCDRWGGNAKFFDVRGSSSNEHYLIGCRCLTSCRETTTELAGWDVYMPKGSNEPFEPV